MSPASAPFMPPAPAQPATGAIEIEITTIDAADRLRQLDQAVVSAIAASFSEIGHRTPIIVRPGEGNGVRLVAGAHRLAAAKQLGWVNIRAEYLDVDAQQARLIEIDENLIRAELTALDRALFLVERKRVYELLNPEAAHGKAPKKQKDSKVANLATFQRYSADAAEKAGLSERTVRRACELAAALSPEAIALIRGTDLADNQSQLKAMAGLEPADQVKVAREIAEGRAPSVAKARVSAGMVPEGGAVREEDRPLARIEPILLRLSLPQLRSLLTMVNLRVEVVTTTRAPRKPKQGESA